MRIRTHSRIIVNFDSFLYYIYFSELFFNAKENKIFTGFKMADLQYDVVMLLQTLIPDSTILNITLELFNNL